MTRPLRPNVVTVTDNPIAQVKCEPDRDVIDLQALLNEILVRFEFNLGTSFDLQFIDMDGKRLLAHRRYVVTYADEELITSMGNYAASMTRSVQRRACEPISDWMIFDPVAEVLRSDTIITKEQEDDDFDIDNASPAFLQEFVKNKRGKGFRPGTSREDMVAEAKKYL